jgi:hypothetical protein
MKQFAARSELVECFGVESLAPIDHWPRGIAEACPHGL